MYETDLVLKDPAKPWDNSFLCYSWTFDRFESIVGISDPKIPFVEQTFRKFKILIKDYLSKSLLRRSLSFKDRLLLEGLKIVMRWAGQL
jgi:hypothetical protein